MPGSKKGKKKGGLNMFQGRGGKKSKSTLGRNCKSCQAISQLRETHSLLSLQELPVKFSDCPFALVQGIQIDQKALKISGG